MSKITLKPLDDGQKAVVIPLGKTTIGRGPFLGCSDKKVSRNHAVLEVTSKGEVYLTPTHVNPCFFLQPGEGDPGVILKKDVPHKLEDGETFSLLPRAYRYQLTIIPPDNRNEVSKGETNGSARDPLDHKDSVTEEKQPTTGGAGEEKEAPAVEPTKKKEPTPPKEEPPKENNNHTTTMKEGEETEGNGGGEEERNHTKREEPKAEKEVEPKEESKESCEEEEESRDEGTLDTLPSKVSEGEEEVEVKAPSKRGRKAGTTTKRKAGGSRGGGRKKLSSRFDFEEGASSSTRVSGGRTSSRTNRQTRQGLSLEDFVVSDDEEWQRSFEDASPTRRRRRRKGGRRAKGEESGSDWETERKRPKKAAKESEESGSDWGTNTPKKKGGRRRKGKASNESEEAGSEPDPDPAPSAPKPRTNCTHGKKCYRRNQSHVSEFSHPGDSDYEETDPKEEEETVKKECPYGANCFRKNAQHKRDFKHTKKVRPQREAAKVADKKGSKSNDEVDSYDLSESLLNDESNDEYKPADSGSDYESGTKKAAKAKGAKRGRKA